jgi:hypothetical protein
MYFAKLTETILGLGEDWSTARRLALVHVLN